jgi:hypothetical protein
LVHQANRFVAVETTRKDKNYQESGSSALRRLRIMKTKK